MTTGPDIFLSYSREDQARAKLFADAFAAQGFSVWWDVGLRTGEAYDEVTEAALRGAKAVVVLWSKTSVASRWVRAEATLADRNKTLVPVMIEACERPIMFELTQTAELMHWQGDAGDNAWRAFLGDVKRFVSRERVAAAPVAAVPARVTQIVSGGPPRIAVMPFTNRSGVAADDIFAVGLVEDLIACLATARGLQVLASGSTAAYRQGTYDIREVGERLGVRYLLEGNTRRVGDTLRVTAQLVEAASGTILWSLKFDRRLSELAELQEDLVTEVAAHLGVQIEALEIDRVLHKTESLSVWDILLRAGIAFSARRVADAAKLAQQAHELEPQNARALALLSGAMALGSITVDTGHELEEAVAYAERALEIDPRNPDVLRVVASTLYLSGQVERGYACAQRACALMPGVAAMHSSLAFACVAANRPAEGHAALEAFERLAPGSMFRATALVARERLYLIEGRLAEALATLQEVFLLAPGDTAAQFDEVIVLELLGRRDDAIRALTRYRKQMPSRTLESTLAIVRRTRPRAPNLQAQLDGLAAVWRALPPHSAGL